MKINWIPNNKAAARALSRLQAKLKKERGIEAPVHVGAEYTLSGLLEVIRHTKDKVVLIHRCHPVIAKRLEQVAQAPERYDLQPGYELHIAVQQRQEEAT